VTVEGQPSANGPAVVGSNSGMTCANVRPASPVLDTAAGRSKGRSAGDHPR